MNRTTTAGLLGAAALALVLTACGDDSDGGNASGDGGNASGDDASTEAEQSSDDQNDDSSGDDQNQETNDVEDATSADSGGSTSEYCTLMAESGEQLLSLDPMSDSGQLLDTFRTIADAAPADVAADWSRFVEIMEIMEDIDPTDPDTMDQLEDTDDIMDVGNRIQQHALEECA